MSDRQPASARPSALTVGLLGAIFLALVVLIVAILSGKSPTPPIVADPKPGHEGPEAPGSATIVDGQTAHRAELAKPPRSPKPVDNPDRIKESLQSGKTYSVVVKGGLEARVEDKDWSISKVTHLAYVVEMMVTRNIESNDGHRIVELRTFDTCRNVKLLCDVDELSIELGTPGNLMLKGLDYLVPGTSQTVLEVLPIAESVLRRGFDAMQKSAARKAVAYVDSLSGKTVRITYLDGESGGVEAIQPVGCSLNRDERDFVFATAILSDCYLLPNIQSKPGDHWGVDGSQFAGFIDPSMRGVPEGQIEIRRQQDEERNGKQYALLTIEKGHLLLNSSDSESRRVGSFTPRGSLHFNLADGYIERSELTGNFVLEQVSKNHILFETSFRTQPKLQLSYSCEMH